MVAGDAERVARTMTDPDARMGALTAVAKALSDAGERDRGRKLLAVALGIADWTELRLSELAHLADDVLKTLAECSLASPTRQAGDGVAV